ncbi:hypothetical protein HMPREF3213_02763 [Heyndrickxia coagulans]|uniref:Uncharacterized protein n=1 Tax=Heyndrickxia coagulans TaxID=1398 RepID=A0A150JYZ4_HEYCO|nr:hypothetical protein HMPREF3213_02763 [Heyndrickxia coagulans]KYC62477.1 hypothetical protein B4100_1528 [Heyndrickxia coagulans]
MAEALLFQLAHQGLECSPFLVWLLDDAKPFFWFIRHAGRSHFIMEDFGEKRRLG